MGAPEGSILLNALRSFPAALPPFSEDKDECPDGYRCYVTLPPEHEVYPSSQMPSGPLGRDGRPLMCSDSRPSVLVLYLDETVVFWKPIQTLSNASPPARSAGLC